MKFSSNDIAEFLNAFPRMYLVPSLDDSTIFEGRFEFNALSRSGPHVTDSYELRISVPPPSTQLLPSVLEVGGRIPRHPDNHVNTDGTLCLGAPLRLQIICGKNSSFLDFANELICPFLYSTTLKERGSVKFHFGELAHGAAGLLSDYEELLGVSGPVAVYRSLCLLLKRRRIANKYLCPCSCGRKLGKCSLRETLAMLQKAVSRRMLSTSTADFLDLIEKQIPKIRDRKLRRK